jgi:AcrR family transcriptional regulator
MGGRSIDATPRKSPRQARSKVTVEAILTAAAQVLIELGYEGATTGRVAERAGVSIGSLYQYFPNKEALIAALIERHADQIVEIMQRALHDPAKLTLEEGLRAIIHAGTRAHRVHPALHKILNEQVPRVGQLAKAMDTHRKIAAVIEDFLRAHAHEMLADHDPAVAAIVIETALEALVHKARHRPPRAPARRAHRAGSVAIDQRVSGESGVTMGLGRSRVPRRYRVATKPRK